MASEEVRCTKCGKLLGKIEDGVFVNKLGRQIVRAVRAEVVCSGCGTLNRAGKTGKIPLAKDKKT